VTVSVVVPFHSLYNLLFILSSCFFFSS
jgi:hypothetical protein